MYGRNREGIIERFFSNCWMPWIMIHSHRLHACMLIMHALYSHHIPRKSKEQTLPQGRIGNPLCRSSRSKRNHFV